MAKSSPLVSVIIPTYNRADIVPNAIESALQQSYSPIEIIVVDDGSKDHTQDVLKGYSSRIIVVTQTNKGVSAARNRGIAKAKGEYIAFLDSDDTWLPEKLKRQIALLEITNSKVPCCLCNIRLAYADKHIGSSFSLSLIKPASQEGLWLNPLEVLATRFILFNQAVVVRRQALEKIGGFDENFRYMEDHDLALRLALLGAWAYVAEPLVIWNEGSDNSLTKQAESQKAQLSKTTYNIYQKIVSLASNGVSPRQSRQLHFELKRNWLKYKADELRCLRSTWFRTLGAGLRLAERYFDKIYTNSPWYPKMKTATIDLPKP